MAMHKVYKTSYLEIVTAELRPSLLLIVENIDRAGYSSRRAFLAHGLSQTTLFQAYFEFLTFLFASEWTTEPTVSFKFISITDFTKKNLKPRYPIIVIPMTKKTYIIL
jgi:hypothetical protein